jgi:23S rRNA pseudouridine2605 synthase
MLEQVGHPVKALERIAFGPLELGGLRAGASRKLGPDEVAALTAASG